jgi:GDP-L-fucose synthase
MPDSLRGRRVIVTGGHGFIGRHVVNRLAAVGAEVSAVHVPGTLPAADLPGNSLAVDLEDAEQVAAACVGAQAVVHLAARAGGIQFQSAGDDTVFATNRRMTDNVLDAASRRGISRVFLASSMVIYRPSDQPIGEDHPQLDPSDYPSPYAWSKIVDESAAVRYPQLEVCIGRFGNVYGPGGSFDPERSTVVHALIDRALRSTTGELTVWGDGTAVRSFVFVEDVARAVVLILGAGAPGTAYNVDSGVGHTIAEVAAAVRDAIDPALRLSFDPSRPTGPQMRVGSIERLRALGFTAPVGLPDGLRETIAWRRGGGG